MAGVVRRKPSVSEEGGVGLRFPGSQPAQPSWTFRFWEGPWPGGAGGRLWVSGGPGVVAGRHVEVAGGPPKGGSWGPQVCHGSTLSPSWRPSAVPRVRWRFAHGEAREVQNVWPCRSREPRGLRLSRSPLQQRGTGRRRGVSTVQFEPTKYERRVGRRGSHLDIGADEDERRQESSSDGG